MMGDDLVPCILIPMSAIGWYLWGLLVTKRSKLLSSVLFTQSLVVRTCLFCLVSRCFGRTCTTFHFLSPICLMTGIHQSG